MSVARACGGRRPATGLADARAEALFDYESSVDARPFVVRLAPARFFFVDADPRHDLALVACVPPESARSRSAATAANTALLFNANNGSGSSGGGGGGGGEPADGWTWDAPPTPPAVHSDGTRARLGPVRHRVS